MICPSMNEGIHTDPFFIDSTKGSGEIRRICSAAIRISWPESRKDNREEMSIQLQTVENTLFQDICTKTLSCFDHRIRIMEQDPQLRHLCSVPRVL